MDSFSAPPPPECLASGSLALHIMPQPAQDRRSTVFTRRPAKKVTRSPTAPTEDVVLLPADHSSQSYRGGENDVSHVDSSISLSTVNDLAESPSPTRDTDELVNSLLSCPSRSPLSMSYPPTQDSSPRHIGTETRGLPEHTHRDWQGFIHAYAHGRWDPRRTPQRPRSIIQVAEMPKVPSTNHLKCDHSEVTASTEVFDVPVTHVSSPSSTAESPALLFDGPIENLEHDQSLTLLSSDGVSQESQALQKSTFLSFPNHTSALKFRAPRPIAPLTLSTYRLRSSFSSGTSVPGDNLPPMTATTNAELQTTVATMRWAAAKVDISPLALPSPEHELTDPMRGITATIPGAHPVDSYSDPSLMPGVSRRSRLTEFWEGTNDVEEDDTHRKRSSYSRNFREESADAEQPPQLFQTLDPPMEADCITTSNSVSPVTRQKSHLRLLESTIPATAPLREVYNASDDLLGDYSGNANSKPTTSSSDVELMANEAVSESKMLLSTNVIPPGGVRLEPIQSLEVGTISVPVAVRKMCLTRQISSPLPIVPPIKADNCILGDRVVSDSPLPKLQRMSKEEQLFTRLGYLVPPDPFDELDRKKALYKYNIWNTSPDTNFDRIAHLAKLVFNTKGVTISLIDGGEIWHKSQWGLKVTNFLRSLSLCGHVVLQRGDEPMVVMDTHLDWRFRRNPLVIGGSRVRFYAGAPLRTQDGFNVGVLSLIDDAPREEFSPRQRHTLKEFAAIVMREMELWRDKIQLRIRDRIQTSMEQFSRECLEIDEESTLQERSDSADGTSMDKVYDRAAKLVKRTLDVEGVVVMDVSHCQVLETMGAEPNVSVTMHCGELGTVLKKQKLTADEYHQLNVFFSKHPEGKIFEGIVPACFRSFLPTHIQYALTVPVYNIDKQLFALICAYNASSHSKRFLEGHELSYLRAIGVIILSAVLKRRMILADKAKSLFISNISHELRTPLHGILAAAELLDDTSLDPSQLSYLQTVQACGTSLVETVNHVLDFTKLSGNAKSGLPSSVDLLRLVEEAVDGCWVGYRARTAIMGDSGIGSVYSPPKEENCDSPVVTNHRHVETIIDIGYRKEGWSLKCEKGGIRRVLMNLFGNSLKFTSDGFIHVMLHQLPMSEDDPPNKVKVELVVLDSGKGISQNFLKNQLFHPFSQENPLQTGTGLGLAIVSSIVTSEVIGGKVDVWSQEGVGTEIKVTFNAEVDDDEFGELNDMEPIPRETGPLPVISLIGFDGSHQGTSRLKKIFRSYLEDWWQFDVVADIQKSNIVILNEEVGPVIMATENQDTSRPFIILSAGRGSPSIMHVATEHERIGGFCRILYKPGGPSRLRSILELAIRASDSLEQKTISDDVSSGFTVDETRFRMPLRNSKESHLRRWPTLVLRSTGIFPESKTGLSVPSVGNVNGREQNNSLPIPPHVSSPSRPMKDPRSTHDHDGTKPTPHESRSESRLLVGLPDPLTDASQRKPVLEILGPQWSEDRLHNVEIKTPGSLQTPQMSLLTNPKAALFETGAAKVTPPSQVISLTDDHRKPKDQPSSTISSSISSVVSVGQSGALLESSVQSEVNQKQKRFRVLVVEDNAILRNLLTKWLSSKGYEFRHAVDGLAGVSVYNEEGPFDVVLLDLSMPVLDGVSAAAMIRKFEREGQDGRHARILALTGMSSLEDKRRAFSAGVDGYLIKPVAFKILDEMFHKMGLV